MIHALRLPLTLLFSIFASKPSLMGERALDHTLTIAEYLAFEAQADLRHEYHLGEIFAMAGGTRNHSILGTNVLTELNLLGRKNGCTTFNGDMRIRIDAENRFLYPEASVVCGPVQASELDPDSITNPVLIVEVLSESTEAYDRGEKFRLYRKLPSLQEYVLISQDRALVEVFTHKADRVWEMRAYAELAETIALNSLNAKIAMIDVYRNVEGVG
jgi:Uma2 family endonuclease